MIRGKGTRILSLNERPQFGTVGIVVTSSPALFSHEPSFILQGIYDALEKNRQHYRIVLKNELDGLLLDNQSLSTRFGGLLFIESAGVEEHITKIQKLNFPYVIANLEKPIKATCTWIDHKKTTNTAVLMLAAMGHEKIVLIARDLGQLFYQDAFEGYKSGLKKAGLVFDENLIIIVESNQEIGAYQAVNNFLKTNELPSAFVACRDYLAYGACAALKEKNISVGKEVSVIGFDNLTWPDDNSYLTTFNEPAYEMGSKAAEMLIERMDSGDLSLERKEVEAPLILRKSVGLNPESPLEANSISLKKFTFQ